jgi:hypothetical protein
VRDGICLIGRAVLHIPGTTQIEVISTDTWRMGAVEVAGLGGVAVSLAVQLLGAVLPHIDVVRGTGIAVVSCTLPIGSTHNIAIKAPDVLPAFGLTVGDGHAGAGSCGRASTVVLAAVSVLFIAIVARFAPLDDTIATAWGDGWVDTSRVGIARITGTLLTVVTVRCGTAYTGITRTGVNCRTGIAISTFLGVGGVGASGI